MLEFKSEYLLIDYLKKQDLKKNNLVLNINSEIKNNKKVPPYTITGYLSDKETGSFPVGERFKVSIQWDNLKGIENSIIRIKQSTLT